MLRAREAVHWGHDTDGLNNPAGRDVRSVPQEQHSVDICEVSATPKQPEGHMTFNNVTVKVSATMPKKNI